MKKKKILIAVVCVIAALSAICLIYLWSGNSFVAEKLSSNPKARASVIEAQYKLSKKENPRFVLLCLLLTRRNELKNRRQK